MNYSPLHIYLQRIDDFGVDDGEARNTKNDALVHAQVGEAISSPQVVADNARGYEELAGAWKIQEREWAEYENGPDLVQRQLTLFIRLI